jgi:hydroxymethylbilane synthase
MLQKVEDARSRTEALAERALIRKVEGGCRFPLGAIATTKDNQLTLYASVFSADGKQNICIEKVGEASEPEKLGSQVADMLIERDAMVLAEGWHRAVEDWNRKL